MTLDDAINKVISDNLNLTCPDCECMVDQGEELHKKIAQATKRWLLDKFSKWVDNRIMDTKAYPGYWTHPDVYRERIDTLNNALTNLKNILEG